MSIEAKEIQKALREEFNFRYQGGYCIKHKCLIEEDLDGSAICPVFEKKASGLWGKMPKEQDEFYLEEGCLYSEHWIGFPTVEQLFGLIREMYGSDWSMAMDFGHFIDDEATLKILFPAAKKSVQELLLIFVMKKKYGKIWDNKEAKWKK